MLQSATVRHFFESRKGAQSLQLFQSNGMTAVLGCSAISMQFLSQVRGSFLLGYPPLPSTVHKAIPFIIILYVQNISTVLQDIKKKNEKQMWWMEVLTCISSRS